MNKMNWFSDEIIFGIVSRQEIEKIIRNPNVNLSTLNLISILDPDGIGKNGKPISNYFFKKFNSYIILRFWDTDGTLENYPSISDEQALKLAKFIWNHRNEKFLVHCNAGISRSAGVGLAIECIVRFNGNKFEFQTSKCKIKEHPRYYPNLYVFNKICEAFDKISFEGI
jgi:predicted protein tyrosine phosphatase